MKQWYESLFENYAVKLTAEDFEMLAAAEK